VFTVRRLLELISRGRRIRRRLPEAFGRRPIIASPDAALRWLKPGGGAFERTLLELATSRVSPGMVVWDVGANVGAFALPAAHCSGATVIAIEADPFLAGLLRDTASIPANQDLDIKVLCAAISDHNGIAEFAISGRGRASNGLLAGALSTQHGATRQILMTPTLTLDAVAETVPAPQLIKIDVEGAELLVLAGAERLLKRHRPIIYVEISGENWTEAAAILKRNNYNLFDGDSDIFNPDPVGDPVVNVLALPAAAADAA
jgi:FkbM family methyltransferase